MQNEEEKLYTNVEIFDAFYGKDYEISIANEYQDFSNCLKNHSVRELLRAKMVDWKIEVFYNFSHVSEETYFRSISIMDLYFKLCPKKLKDKDVHLIGIGSMFIATKIEDIYHIDLKSMVERVGHNKFNELQIKEIEREILMVLKYNVLFANHFTCLMRVHYLVTNHSDS